MSQIIQKITGFLLILLAVIIALFFIKLSLGGAESMQQFYESLFSRWFPPNKLLTRALLGVIGLVLLFISICFTFLSIIPSRKARTAISFSNPSGEVQISAEAIEGYIRKVAMTISEVEKIRETFLEEGPTGLIIYAKVDVNDSRDLPLVTSELQDTIKNSLKVKLGLEQISEVRVSIGNLSQGPGGKVKLPKPGAGQPVERPEDKIL